MQMDNKKIIKKGIKASKLAKQGYTIAKGTVKGLISLAKGTAGFVKVIIAGGLPLVVIVLVLLATLLIMTLFSVPGGTIGEDNSLLLEKYIGIKHQLTDEKGYIDTDKIFATDVVLRTNQMDANPDNVIVSKEIMYNFYDQNQNVNEEYAFNILNWNEAHREFYFRSKEMFKYYFNIESNMDNLFYPIKTPYIITAGFQDDNYEDSLGMIHTGMDFVPLIQSFETNWKALSTANGVVKSTYTSCPLEGNITSTCGDKYNQMDYGGNSIVIEHTNLDGTLFYSTYAHLKQINVNVGDIVEAGQEIGIIGNSGRSTGRHLHFEIRINENKFENVIDPGSHFIKEGEK